MKRFCSQVILYNFFAFLAFPAYGEGDGDINFREQCRRTVSGILVTIIADARQAKEQIVLSENFIKKSKLQLSSDETKLKTINKAIVDEVNRPDLLSERDLVTSRIRMYHNQLLESQERLKSAKQDFEKKSSQEKKFTAIVNQLFKVYRAEDPNGLPETVFQKIEWKHSCPPYRALCPLPEKQLRNLISLLDFIHDTGQACFKYSKIK